MGVTKPADADDEVVVYREPARGIYKKLIVRGGQIAGAILLGDIEAASTLMQMFMAGTQVPARRADLLFGSPTGVSLLKASDLPDNAQICNCNGVSKKQIVDAIQIKGCQSVSKVGACTKAGMRLRFVQEPGGAASRSLSSARWATTRPSTTTCRACRSRNRSSSPRSAIAESSPSAKSSRSWRTARKTPPARSAWRRC